MQKGAPRGRRLGLYAFPRKIANSMDVVNSVDNTVEQSLQTMITSDDQDGTEMMKLEVSEQRPGEEPHASLIREPRQHDGDEGMAAVNETQADLRLKQSLCYIGAFIAAGLIVGTCGPALPTLLNRINSSQGAKTEREGESSLAAAFAFRWRSICMDVHMLTDRCMYAHI